MGVPKFFRWMSERYPAISQLIADNRIPEFDCLYLDMNGIIHNCTHKDSDSASHRITEEEMFINIFNYIEHLFATIKPKQLFFMAVDGVAPRAKMNQQRARRFRSAYDAEKAYQKAIKEGEPMPDEPPFDSNCITPGTLFMEKLTKQLKYFIHKKISEDANWRGVEVVLSGHEVPGEGEHKIMEYIRQRKAQKDYPANLRHCLYGLDADLIMLGLLSHDPHFCLLREEVTFGRKPAKQKELEYQNFYLMHLCVVREYLELEFQELKQPGVLQMPYNFEHMIDDFILMAFFVGNDFLPNLPHLHINEGALSLMFDCYKKVLPRLDGYMNDAGTIRLDRLRVFLKELQTVEFRFFEHDNQDAVWLKVKQSQDKASELANDGLGNKSAAGSVAPAPSKPAKATMTVTHSERSIYFKVKKWLNSPNSFGGYSPLALTSDLQDEQIEFVKKLARDLNVQYETPADSAGRRYIKLLPPPVIDGDGENSEEDEAQLANFRVFKKYDNAKVVSNETNIDAQAVYNQKFQNWKNDYYKNKFDWDLSNKEELRKLTENYVQGLQWVLYYYYKGCASWSWFFQYHYSPMMSDVHNGLDVSMEFDLGQPFHPFEQLMGVLPDRSKAIVPTAYHSLMTDLDSPIIDFYPHDFDLDMNGKKQEWEAVVKIPFINEKRLLMAMRTKEPNLTDEERSRNSFGATLKFTYSRDTSYFYETSLVGVFNHIYDCKCVENIFELPTLEGTELFNGLTKGVKLGTEALAGFPSLYNLPFTGTLAFHGVSVFQQESRNQSMIVTLTEAESASRVNSMQSKLGNVVHVNYPFLQEARIIKVMTYDTVYSLGPDRKVVSETMDTATRAAYNKHQHRIEHYYSKRLGLIIGDVETVVEVELLKGLTKNQSGDSIKEYGEINGVETHYAAQIIVDEVKSVDQRFVERKALPLNEDFPVGTLAFFLGEAAFGQPMQVLDHQNNSMETDISVINQTDLRWANRIVADAERNDPYMPSHYVARKLNLNSLVLSKLTSSLSMDVSGLKVNLGLNFKFEAKKLKVLGLSRRTEYGWEFSQRAIDLIAQYMIRFPEFIGGLQNNPKGNIYRVEQFYPENGSEKIKEITQWLRSIETKKFEKVPLDAQQLDSDVVLKIERQADNLTHNQAPAVMARLQGVPRNAVLKPSDASVILAGQNFQLGDRVLYALDSGKVPTGMRGTIVGVTKGLRSTHLDVLFDYTFMSGSSLGDRCSPFRGASVLDSAVLNITSRELVYQVTQPTQNSRGRGRTNTAHSGVARGALAGGRGGNPAGPVPGPNGENLWAPPPSLDAWQGGSASIRRGRGGVARGSALQNGRGGTKQERRGGTIQNGRGGRGGGATQNGRGARGRGDVQNSRGTRRNGIHGAK